MPKLKDISIQAVLLICAIILLPATRLYLIQQPLRYGAIVSALFMLYSFIKQDNRIEYHTTFSKCLFFMILAFIIGFCIQYHDTYTLNPLFLHNITAYTLVFLYVVTLEKFKLDIDFCIKTSAIILPILYVFFPFYSPISPRLIGLSLNPNQFALALLLTPFLLLYYFHNSSNLLKALAIAAFIIKIYLAYEIRSRAEGIAWTAGAMTMLFYIFKHNIAKLGILFLGLYLIFHILQQAGALYFITKGTLMTYGEPSDRWSLLINGVQLFLKKPFWGYGPGAFLHSNAKSALNIEPHNIILTIALQGGVLALGAYLYLCIYLMKRCLKYPILLSMFVALMVFSAFQPALRQPIFWIYLYWLNYQASALNENIFSETERLVPRLAYQA